MVLLRREEGGRGREVEEEIHKRHNNVLMTVSRQLLCHCGCAPCVVVRRLWWGTTAFFLAVSKEGCVNFRGKDIQLMSGPVFFSLSSLSSCRPVFEYMGDGICRMAEAGNGIPEDM